MYCLAAPDPLGFDPHDGLLHPLATFLGVLEPPLYSALATITMHIYSHRQNVHHTHKIVQKGIYKLLREKCKHWSYSTVIQINHKNY